MCCATCTAFTSRVQKDHIEFDFHEAVSMEHLQSIFDGIMRGSFRYLKSKRGVVHGMTYEGPRVVKIIFCEIDGFLPGLIDGETNDAHGVPVPWRWYEVKSTPLPDCRVETLWQIQSW